MTIASLRCALHASQQPPSVVFCVCLHLADAVILFIYLQESSPNGQTLSVINPMYNMNTPSKKVELSVALPVAICGTTPELLPHLPAIHA